MTGRNAIAGFGKIKRQLDGLMEEIAGRKVESWVLHDLRRTMATRWQEMGIDIITTERMLSHRVVTGGLVGVYQRYDFVREMRAAVERWEQFLSGLLNAERDLLT